MLGILADLRHALRIYGRTPVASGLAVIVLAVAVAFVTAFLSLYVDLAHRTHPGLERGGRLVTLGQPGQGIDFQRLPLGLVERLNEEMTSLDGVTGVLSWSERLFREGRAELDLVSREFFPIMRPKLLAGRGFERAEHDAEAEPVAVISYRYWQDNLGGADVLGTTIVLEPRGAFLDDPTPVAFRIVGIMAPEVTRLIGEQDVSVWLPLERLMPHISSGMNAETFIQQLRVWVFGRRAAGASTRAVTEEIATRYTDAMLEYGMPVGAAIEAVDGIVYDLSVQRDARRQLRLFLGASLLLAVVAAANVSLFLLARAPGRRQEIGIRTSVGAPLGRLVRQLAGEGGLLVLAAGAGGICLSIWLSQFLRGLDFLRRAEWQDVTLLEWRVLGLAGLLLLALSALVSLEPIFGLRRSGIAASSRATMARATVLQRTAGAVQIAIAGSVGAASIAFAWDLGSLTFGDAGYETRDRHLVNFNMESGFQNRLLAEAENLSNPRNSFAAYLERMRIERIRQREALSAIPGVAGVAFGMPVPGDPRGAAIVGLIPIADPRDPTATIRVRAGSIDSRFVDVLGLHLVRGRAPLDEDLDVALVNQRFALELFGREDVVGERLSRSQGEGLTLGEPEIIGVLEDLSFVHPATQIEPMLFLTLSQGIDSSVVESSLSAAALQQEIERIAGGGETELSVWRVVPLAALRNDLLAADRARGFLTIGTAALVVLLAAYGFYGMQRYLVAAGRREYAIRSSLGAGPRALGWLVVWRGLTFGLPGLVLGAMLAYITVSWLRDDLVSRDVSAFAVTVVVAAGLVLLLAAASFGPARQAMRTQPAPLLREE